MFWTFGNPIRHIRRVSGPVEYTLLPSRRSSVQSDHDTEKGVPEDEEVLERLEDRRKKGIKALVVLLLFGLGCTAIYHQTLKRLETIIDEEPTAAQSESPFLKEEGTITREVVYDPHDPNHVYLSPLSPLPHSRPLLTPTTPAAALRSLLASGELDDFNGTTTPTTVDIVYLWVNSTDPAFPGAYAERMEEEGLPVDRGQARRWRDNGELRGAVRSSVQSLGEGLRKVHVVSADYPERPTWIKRQQQEDADLAVTDEFDADWLGTSGQIPDWLDWEAQEEGTAEKVNWHFHSDIFRLPRGHQGQLAVDQEVLGEYELVSYNDSNIGTFDAGDTRDMKEERLEEAWRELSLPSFNSFAIESRVGWITGLNENL